MARNFYGWFQCMWLVSLLVIAASGIAYFDASRLDSKGDSELFANSPAACAQNGIHLRDINVYLINLDRNKERLEHFLEQYLMSDLRYKQFQRFRAVDGKVLDVSKLLTDKAYNEVMSIEKTGFRTKHYQLTRGAIGCYLSHLNLYKTISEGDKPYGLVFEDDIIISNNIFANLNKALANIPNDWDMLLLGCYCISCDRYEKYYDLDRFFLLHAYIIKKEAAARIYEELNAKKIVQQIDSELSDMINVGKLKVYCLRNMIAKQGGKFRTTIQTPLKMVPGTNPYMSIART